MRRFGVAVSARRVRAVLVKGSQVIWAAQRSLQAPAELETALAELAAEGPQGVRRARVVLEPDLCQFKVIEGLPRLRRSALRRAVALHATRWFARNGDAPVTDAVRLARTGPVLATCASADTVEVVARGIAQAGLTLERISPATVALASALPDGIHEWGAGHSVLTLEVKRALPVRVRRSASPDASAAEPPATMDPALAAAVGRSPLSLLPASVATVRAQRRRKTGLRLLIFGGVLWAFAGIFWFARVGSAIDDAGAGIAALELRIEPAIAVERDLARVEDALRILGEAVSTRSRDLRLLAALTQSLPDSIYLLSLQRGPADTVTVSGLAPSAGGVVALLKGVPGLHGPKLEGPVTREPVPGGSVRDRFVLRFVWKPEGTS